MTNATLPAPKGRASIANDPADSLQPPVNYIFAGVIFTLVLVIKLLAIHGYRIDSDETQHAHVVWGWATGRLQYRDLFDNHMPIFHMLFGPYFALFGEDPNIMLPLRLAMLPFYAACLWSVYRLGTILFSRRAGWWCCLVAALIPPFFFPSTEFRTDNLWAVCWFISLIVAISGAFTLRRAFMVGLLLGLTSAASTKTCFLMAALSIAAVFALALRWWMGRKRVPASKIILALILIGCGGLIFPGALALFFMAKGAFPQFFYCVFQHNVVPHLKRWGHINYILWVFPLTLPFLGAYAVYVFRQAGDTGLGARRVLVLLTPYLYAGIMFSYCPDLSRQDNLPAVPLLPLTLIPFLISIGRARPGPRLSRSFFKYALPLLLLVELYMTCRGANLRGSALEQIKRQTSTVLSLTDTNDYVMDDKGDFLFRPRAFYWVLEPVTRARLKMGWIEDDIPARLVATDTRVCQLCPTRPGTASAKFIVGNYMPFDMKETNIGAAGKIIGSPAPGERCQFNVAIDATYVFDSEFGPTHGSVDGVEYSGAVRLRPGSHFFQRTAGSGRLAIFLARAAANGYKPLFDVSANLVKEMNEHASRRE